MRICFLALNYGIELFYKVKKKKLETGCYTK